MASSKKPKIVLAVQGSFGHIDYAAGLLDAFRAHNHAAKTNGKVTIDIAAGSGCVEMLTPLWVYLSNQNSDVSMRDLVLQSDAKLSLLAQSRIAPPSVRLDVWSSFFSGMVTAQKNLVDASLSMMSQKVDATSSSNVAPISKLIAAWQDALMYSSGLPGQIAFNPLFTAAKKAGLDMMCDKTDGPTLFTNATRASDFQEIYLFSGTAPNQDQTEKMVGSTGKRQVRRLTPEYFFASGARPPYIAPMPVSVDEKTEYWMEGAMRCNPPLTPLIDMDATHILLIRFFSKYESEAPNNNAELNERFLDAIFNIPLQKEIESIELNNDFVKCLNQLPKQDGVPENLRHRREVVILDPADFDNQAFSPDYVNFLHSELNSLSHFDASIPVRGAEMFDRGFEIGTALIAHLLKYLPKSTPEKGVGEVASDHAEKTSIPPATLNASVIL